MCVCTVTCTNYTHRSLFCSPVALCLALRCVNCVLLSVLCELWMKYVRDCFVDCFVVIWKHFCFILSTGTKIRIDSVMRHRSSGRGRNTSASVTVTITVFFVLVVRVRNNRYNMSSINWEVQSEEDNMLVSSISSSYLVKAQRRACVFPGRSVQEFTCAISWLPNLCTGTPRICNCYCVAAFC